MSPALTALCDAMIFTGEAMVEGHALLIQSGKIIDIAGNRKIPADAQKKFLPDLILAPGFIDVQVNGGGNVLFNNAPIAESCRAIAKAHRKYGTMHILPTIISDTAEVTQKAIVATRTARKADKSILGIHIEGPHLSVEARGAHKQDRIRAMSTADLSVYHREGDEVMLMTVAPENVSPQQIKTLRAQGVIVSLGHTTASPEQIRAALEAGATGFTHLYNGMGGAGSPTAKAAVADRNSWCSLIADGHHVSVENIRAALSARPAGKVFLVSDAMSPAATENPQPFRLYGQEVRIENGRGVHGEANRPAGSVITLSDAVRYCVQKVGIDLGEALRMASAYPAVFLGLDTRLGRLSPGFEGSIIALSTDLTHIQNIT